MPPEPQSEPAPCPRLREKALAPSVFVEDNSTFVNHQAGVCLLDANGRILAADAVANEWLNRKTTGDGLPTIFDLLGDELATAWLAQLFEQRSAETLTATLYLDGTNSSPVEATIQRLDGPAGPLALMTFPPATSESPLNRDAVTGLPDRRAIASWISGVPQSGSKARRPFAVLFLDLNDFKQINDAHGHAAGDAVLGELARRWSTAVRDGDLVTRYGGDEFVILLKNIADADSVEPVVERLRVATLAPIVAGGTEVSLSATIGIAVNTDGSGSIESLIASADEDMYARKRRRPK
jgi:diguanylate cyclase (GGDEF)-like protein